MFTAEIFLKTCQEFSLSFKEEDIPKIQANAKGYLEGALKNFSLLKAFLLAGLEDEQNNNVLHYAVKLQDPILINFLRKGEKAEETVRVLTSINNEGFTPVDLAIELDNKKVIIALTRFFSEDQKLFILGKIKPWGTLPVRTIMKYDEVQEQNNILSFNNPSSYNSSSYNPFIHGTRSSILAILPKTNFTLMSPVKMIDEYQLAPLCGELRDGYVGLWSPCDTSFGRIEETTGCYSKSKVMSSYAMVKRPLPKRAVTNQAEMKTIHENNVANINKLLLTLTREKNMGLGPDPSYVASLKKEISLTIQYIYLLLCLGDNFSVNDTETTVSDLAKEREYYRILFPGTEVSLVKQKILQSNLDFCKVWKSPTQEVLKLIQEMFKIKVNDQIETFLFVTRKERKVEPIKHMRVCSDFVDLVSSGHNILDYCFRKIFVGFAPDIFNWFRPLMIQHAARLEKKLDVISKICERADIIFTDQEKEMYRHEFPIIFVTERADLMHAVQGEFRTNQPLKLGQEITTVATDNKEHKEKLQQYLKQHKLDSVTVILFDDLKSSQRPGISNNPQSSVETHTENKTSSLPLTIQRRQILNVKSQFHLTFKI